MYKVGQSGTVAGFTWLFRIPELFIYGLLHVILTVVDYGKMTWGK
jgi:hypothetical protein